MNREDMYIKYRQEFAPNIKNEAAVLSDREHCELNLSVEQGLNHRFAQEEFVEKGVEWGSQKFQTLGIQTKEGLYTNLGLLLSDECLHTIKVAAFQGTGKSVFKDRKEFLGSLLKQLRDAYDYLQLMNPTGGKGMGRDWIEERAYPQEAIREALMNAIVHRDYSFSGSTIINIYDDRMEFISLGGLVNGLDIKDIRMGVSQTRNEKLSDVFYRLKHIEACGTGIQKIFELYKDAKVKPTIRVTEHVFVIELTNQFSTKSEDEAPDLHEAVAPYEIGREGLNEQQTLIMSYIKIHGEITNEQVQVLLDIKRTRAFIILKQMTEAGILNARGRGDRRRYLPREELSS